ncbi:MAG: hypothetical protein ABSE52_08840 [Candidatus Dormibacteria bacterium]|jgi:hypothetical protein
MAGGTRSVSTEMWLLVGLVGGFVVYIFPTVGLLLAMLLLAMAVSASMRGRPRAAWAACLCGICAVLLPFAIAVTLASPLLGGLLVALCAGAVVLGIAGLRVRRDLTARTGGR